MAIGAYMPSPLSWFYQNYGPSKGARFPTGTENQAAAADANKRYNDALRQQMAEEERTAMLKKLGKRMAAEGAAQDRFAGQQANALAAGQAEANRANRLRLAQALANVNAMGAGERYRIGRAARMGQASALQRLYSAGLGASTVVEPVMRGYQETANVGYMDLAGRLAQARNQIILGVTDQGPNMGQSAQYLEQLGQARGYRF